MTPQKTPQKKKVVVAIPKDLHLKIKKIADIEGKFVHRVVQDFLEAGCRKWEQENESK